VIQDDDEHVPFAFHVALPEEATKPDAPTRIVISKSIEVDVLAHASHAFSEEDVLVVRCAPQSVFKVRPATRCSATLSGLLIVH
jgi:ribosome assembly protein 4